MAELTNGNSDDAPSSISEESVGVIISPQKVMQKVPEFLRQDERNKRDYDPVYVSFGPYHHGKASLKFAEDLKPKAVELFVEGTGKDTNYLYDKVLEVIDDVRRCYVQNSTDKYNDSVFARMMLQDACFLINYMFIGFSGFVHLGALACTLILRDMFCLENQIPFWFLKLMTNLKYGEDNGKEMIGTYIFEKTFGELRNIVKNDELEEEPLHLLEAFRRVVVNDVQTTHRDSIFKWLMLKACPSYCLSKLQWLKLKGARISKACSSYCLSKLQWLWGKKRMEDVSYADIYIHSFRSVTDLKAKGIRFRPSPTRSLKAIKFKSSRFSAELQLPIWCVAPVTKVLFLNMVSFELCPDNPTDLAVTSYLEFMKALIVSPKDIKELRENRILLNTIGSDEEVFQVFKDIKTFGLNNDFLFYEVNQKIQEHYNSKRNTWVGELLYTYFRSPWSIIALLAAMFLLGLTVTQTYFTIHPKN